MLHRVELKHSDRNRKKINWRINVKTVKYRYSKLALKIADVV